MIFKPSADSDREAPPFRPPTPLAANAPGHHQSPEHLSRRHPIPPAGAIPSVRQRLPPSTASVRSPPF